MKIIPYRTGSSKRHAGVKNRVKKDGKVERSILQAWKKNKAKLKFETQHLSYNTKHQFLTGFLTGSLTRSLTRILIGKLDNLTIILH